MKRHAWVIGAIALAMLSGCNTMERYRASVEQGCREQANGKSARYNECMRRATAVERQQLRHQDQEWADSLYDIGQFPVVYVAPRPPHWR